MIIKNQPNEENRIRKYNIIILKRCLGMAIFFLVCTVYRCPIKYFIHIDCPGCGTTRALISALRLDFSSSIKYNACFPIPIFWCIYILFKEKICIDKQKEELLVCLSILLYLFRWIFSLI